jgi:hypothetical protein
MRSFKLESQQVGRKILRYELVADVAQDLYEKNYSTVKSTYGIDTLGDGTYVGEELITYDTSPATIGYTNTGEILLNENRYRDTLAPIKLISIDTSGASLSTAPSDTTSNWLLVAAGDTLARWVKSSINATITIEVGPSIITALQDETALLARVFPAWMDIRTDTTSNGYKLLNMFSDDTERLKVQSVSHGYRDYVDSIPEGIKAFAYLSELLNEESPIDVIAYDDSSPSTPIVLSPAEDLKEFIEAEVTKHLYYQDGKYLFACGEYDNLEINGATFTQEEVHILNWFDNIGIYMDLPRLELESNTSYKARIKDVFVNPPGASHERFQLAIERESGCTIEEVWELTDGILPWETPNDPAATGVYYTDASDDHKEIAEWARNAGAVGYDYLHWGKAMFDLYPHPWDLAEIPYLLDKGLDDTTPVTEMEQGIGYGDDLYPTSYIMPGSFTYAITVGARGYLESDENMSVTPEMNYCTNPSLETDTNADGLADSFAQGGHDTSGVFTFSRVAGRISGLAQRMQYTGVGDTAKAIRFISQPFVGLSAGDTVTLSFYVRGSVGTTDPVAYIQSQNVSHVNVDSQAFGMGGITSEWTRRSVTKTLGANAVEVLLLIKFQRVNTGDVIDFTIDDILIKKAVAISPYFDGSYPGSRWTGIPNASTSERRLTPQPVTVSGRVVPSGIYTEYHNEFSGFVTLEIVASGVTYVNIVPVDIPRDTFNAVNSNTWMYTLPQFGISQNINGFLKSDTTPPGSDKVDTSISQEDITSYTIIDGVWNFVTQTYDANSPASELTAGFEEALSSETWIVASHSSEHPLYMYVEFQTSLSPTTVSWTGLGTPFVLTCNTDNTISNASIDIPRNLEKLEGVGTVTYTLVVDSISPDDASLADSPIDTICEFSTSNDTIVGWPVGGTTINLSSTYSTAVTMLTPYIHPTDLVFAGTVSTGSPVEAHTILYTDFSFPANFVNGRYEVQTVGNVFVRLASLINDTSDQMVVELNPYYMFEWCPKVQPGTLYLSGNEYYLHADTAVTENIVTKDHVLSKPIWQRSLLSFNEDLMETHFTDVSGVPTLSISQNIVGNGTRYLPLWYEEAINVIVDGVSKTLLGPGILDFGVATTDGQAYTATYQITDSYCVDYAWIEFNEFRPKIYLQAEHPGLTVTYTPYSEYGYSADTGVPTNPLYTNKNRDFLYLDDEIEEHVSIELVTVPPILYRDRDNPMFARVLDVDGNGAPGVSVIFTTDDSQYETDVTDNDGYAHVFIEGPAPDDSPLFTHLHVTATTVTSPALVVTQTYQAVTIFTSTPQGINLTEQAFQVAIANQSVPQTIELLLLDEDGAPVHYHGTYTVWCSNPSGIVTSTNIATGETDGVATLTYTPTYLGRYVATFTFGADTKHVGWELVERT